MDSTIPSPFIYVDDTVIPVNKGISLADLVKLFKKRKKTKKSTTISNMKSPLDSLELDSTYNNLFYPQLKSY